LAASASLVRRKIIAGAFSAKSGLEMQHEWIRVGAQLRHDERRLVGHQAADEMGVATEPIELCHDDRRFGFPCRL
jgi:hypothetical protein